MVMFLGKQDTAGMYTLFLSFLAGEAMTTCWCVMCVSNITYMRCSAQGTGTRKARARARHGHAQGSGVRKAAARARQCRARQRRTRQRRAQGSQGRAPPWSCVLAFLFVEVSSVIRG